ILNVDAITCLAFGALLVFAAAPLATLLGLPQALLFWAGVVLFPSAALMLLAASKPSTTLVRMVMLGNVAWVLASVMLVFALEPNALGVAFLLVQAAAVTVLLALEWRLRRGG